MHGDEEGSHTAFADISHTVTSVPIFDSQAWNAAEVDQIARKEQEVIREGDRSDLEVHWADAKPLPTQLLVNVLRQQW